MGEEVSYIWNKPLHHIGQNGAPYSSQPSRKNLSLKSEMLMNNSTIDNPYVQWQESQDSGQAKLVL